MKASIFLAIYEKFDVLPNVLYSLNRQNTTFPFEICIIDDCSSKDPEPLIKRFLTDVDYKYKRLDKNLSTMFSQCKCWDLISDDSEVIILLSSDVILTSDNIIEDLCKNVARKQIALCDVRNSSTPKNFWKGFDKQVVNFFSSDWKSLTAYQGPYKKGRWYFFLGAIRRKDLKLVGHEYMACDVVIAQNLKKNGFSAYYSDLVGVHQKHGLNKWPCSVKDTCTYKCYRKKKKK